MKFGSIWKQQINELPINLQSTVLSYKKWKKISKLNYNENLLKTLEEESKNINNIIKNNYNNFNINNIIKLKCCNSNIEKISKKDLYLYIMLNKTTLYKICKRIDKRNNFNLFMTWLNKNYKTFYFNYGLYYTRTLFENNEMQDVICPICLCDLEVTIKNPILIMNCGHLMCFDCILQYYNISKNHGTLKNLISYHDHYLKPMNCPECREDYPFYNMNYLNVGPLEAKYIINKVL